MPWLVCYATTWLHVVLASFPGPAARNWVRAQPRKRRTLQPGPNYAICARSRGKRRTLQLGPNYATLVWHRRHLACRRQARIFPACTIMWPLAKSWKVSKIGPAMAWATHRLRRPCDTMQNCGCANDCGHHHTYTCTHSASSCGNWADHREPVRWRGAIFLPVFTPSTRDDLPTTSTEGKGCDVCFQQNKKP